MAKKKRKKKRAARSIIQGHLEKVSSAVFERYLNEITSLISGNQGVYALYRRHKLYYIGLASNLKWRIRHHLRDKHKGKWDRFSLYIIRKEDHIREIEALLVRIAGPAGNSQKGRLKKSLNLLPKLKREVKRKQDEERLKLFEERIGLRKKKSSKQKKKNKISQQRVDRPLKGLLGGGKRLYADYKGKTYKACVYNNGKIKYDGRFYESPSAVGCFIRGGKSTNGWRFWKYKNKSGELVSISELRK